MDSGRMTASANRGDCQVPVARDKYFVDLVLPNGDRESIPYISSHFVPRIAIIAGPSLVYRNVLLNLGDQNKLAEWDRHAARYKKLLEDVLQLPYHSFWSVIVYEDLFWSNIIAYLNEIKTVSIDFEGFYSIHSTIMQIFFRLSTLEENDENFVSSEFHQQAIQGCFPTYEAMLALFDDFIHQSQFAILLDRLSFLLDTYPGHFKRLVQNYCDEIKSRFVLATNNIVGRKQSFREMFDIWQILDMHVNFIFRLTFQNVDYVNEIVNGSRIVQNLVAYADNIFFAFREFSSQYESVLAVVQQKLNFFQMRIGVIFRRYVDEVLVAPLASSQDTLETFNAIEQFNVFMMEIFRSELFIVNFFNTFPFEELFREFLCNDAIKRTIDAQEFVDGFKNVLDQARAENEPNNLYLDEDSEASSSSGSSTVQDEPPKMLTSSSSPAVIESAWAKTRSVLEIMPDFGEGFVYLCLEFCDFNVDDTVNLLLEDAIPSQLSHHDRHLTRANVENMKKRDASIKKPQVVSAYIGKKDKVASTLKQNKGNGAKEELKQRVLSLNQDIDKREDERYEEAVRLVERGADIQEMRSNIEYIGIDLYNDEFDDTYENEDLTQDKLFNEDDEEPEQVADSQRDQRATGFVPNEKFSNAAQYRKNQFQNKKDYFNKQRRGPSGGGAAPSSGGAGGGGGGPKNKNPNNTDKRQKMENKKPKAEQAGQQKFNRK